MSDIQRWSMAYTNDRPHPEGKWVRYADHVEALRQAEIDVQQAFQHGLEVGQRDALAGAVQRVEALPAEWWDGFGNDEYDAVIAAIKGDSDD